MLVPVLRSVLTVAGATAVCAAALVAAPTAAVALAAPAADVPSVVGAPLLADAAPLDLARERTRRARTAKSAKSAKSARAAKASRASKARSRSARRSRAAKSTRSKVSRRRTTARTRPLRLATVASTATFGELSLAGVEAPVTLRGSKVAVEQAYQVARSRGVPFTTTRGDALREAEEGSFVRLSGSNSVRLKGVSLPFVRPATRSFVASFGASYRAACGEPLTVTSAIRPRSVRLANSVEKSVHPTGMAVDLRVPRNGCRNWMRRELIAMEQQGLVQATEERRPAHFHVVVLRAP